MTVGELIAALQAFDADLPVIMPSETYDFCRVGRPFLDLACFEGAAAQLTDERETGFTPVVRLFEPEDPDSTGLGPLSQ